MRNFAAFVQDRASYTRVTLNLGEVGIPVTGYSPRTFTDAGPDNLANTSDDRPITLYADGSRKSWRLES